MEIVDPGHVYKLSWLDGEREKHIDAQNGDLIDRSELIFVKRTGENYPGNENAHPGTTTQEVLRALIDRTKYVQRQKPHAYNGNVLHDLRMTIYWLEARAAEIAGREFVGVLPLLDKIETLPVCKVCHHILLETEPHEHGYIIQKLVRATTSSKITT